MTSTPTSPGPRDSGPSSAGATSGGATSAGTTRAIADLSEGSEVSEQVCRIEGVQVRTSRRNGTAFVIGRLADASGAMDMIAFNLTAEQMDALRGAGLVRISGLVGVHGGRLQLNASRIEPEAAELSLEDRAQLFPRTRRDPEAMADDVRRLLESLDHPGMGAIARAYLDDAPLMDAFRSAPAATGNHHAWIGGLLEHTWELMQMADAILGTSGGGGEPAMLFGGLDRDLVLLALFLHDLDKVHELAWDGEFRYTRRGNLVGHLVGGAIELERRVRSLVDAEGRPMEVPDEVVDVLVHLLVSHHGRLEHGAARLPATPEAVFVAALDDLAARTSVAVAATGRDRGEDPAGPASSDFTDPHWSLGTRLYRRDVVAGWTPDGPGGPGGSSR